MTDIETKGSAYDPIRREILNDFYSIRQDIIFEIANKDEMHPKTARFLDVLKYAITEFEKIEKDYHDTLEN